MQHLLENYHILWKGPIDGVRLAYQKIKRKETSSFQVVSEEDQAGTKEREVAYTTLILNNFMKALWGFFRIVGLCEEGLLSLDFCDPKEEVPDPYGRWWNRSIPTMRRWRSGWSLFCWGSNRYQLSTSTARNSLSRVGVAVIARDPIWRDQDPWPACPGSSCGSAQAVAVDESLDDLSPLPPCDGKDGQLTGYASDLRSQTLALTIHEGITWKEK